MNIMKKLLLSIFATSFFLANAQIKIIEKKATITAENYTDEWQINVFSVEAPFPGNNTYRNFLHQQKQMKFSNKSTPLNLKKTDDNNNELPINPIGFVGNPFNGIPNDNDLAISNDGTIASVCNSTIYSYNENGDLLHNSTLNSIGNQLGLPNQSYDPKIIYDQNEDRFIMLFLNGSNANNTNLVLCFSVTNNPADGWHVYRLEGNPLNNNAWSDFPMIAITEKDFFVTVNLISSDSSSWQTGFLQSVIWQVQKDEGYQGDSINTKLHTEVKHNNRYIRNLLPIQGGITVPSETMYFISNRNFDFENDTFFVVKINQSLNTNPNVGFQTQVVKSNISYGLPPDANQPTNRFLQTNDARALSGFIQNNLIQFVGNTVNFDNDKATIYHALYNVNSNQVNITILSDTTLEYGYPNISHSGQHTNDVQSIISFNHTSTDSFPGVSAIFYSELNGYSDRLHVKSGNSHVNVISGNFQRWGDYTGSQRKYNEPGTVWMSGFIGDFVPLGLQKNRHITYIAKLISPDSTNVENSINNLVSKNTTKLYPNPTQFERIFFQFEVDNSESMYVSISNINGQIISPITEVYAKKGNNEIGFNIEHLSKGVYFVNLYSSNKELKYSNQFIKQ